MQLAGIEADRVAFHAAGPRGGLDDRLRIVVADPVRPEPRNVQVAAELLQQRDEIAGTGIAAAGPMTSSSTSPMSSGRSPRRRPRGAVSGPPEPGSGPVSGW